MQQGTKEEHTVGLINNKLCQRYSRCSGCVRISPSSQHSPLLPGWRLLRSRRNRENAFSVMLLNLSDAVWQGCARVAQGCARVCARIKSMLSLGAQGCARVSASLYIYQISIFLHCIFSLHTRVKLFNPCDPCASLHRAVMRGFCPLRRSLRNPCATL